MKLTEYNQQMKEAAKRPAFSVIVEPNDIISGWKISEFAYNICINAGGMPDTFYVEIGTAELYEIVEHNQKGKGTCFKLSDEAKKLYQ